MADCRTAYGALMHPTRRTPTGTERDTVPSDATVGERSVSERDAADLTGYSADALKKWRREGTCPAFLLHNRSIRYRLADLIEWQFAHRVETRDMGPRESRRRA